MSYLVAILCLIYFQINKPKTLLGCIFINSNKTLELWQTGFQI